MLGVFLFLSFMSYIKCFNNINRFRLLDSIRLLSAIPNEIIEPKVNFYSFQESEFISLLSSWKQPKFRLKQIKSWIYEKGCEDFDEMNNIPIELREKLKSFFTFGVLELATEQISQKDGTRKRAYRLHDGQLIESVLMSYNDHRRTACISSQAGCAMGCVFCATGQMGFSRQLTEAEIFEQAQRFSSELKKLKNSDGSSSNERLSNVVMMGMGEPLANYDNVMGAIRRMNTELGIGARHITISTVGLAPRIRRLADEDIQVSLAISLHQPTDVKRSALMPINKRFNIEELLSATRYYMDKTHRRVSFEWALIRGETDTQEVARDLGKLLSSQLPRQLCHVNVIPLNPTSGYDGRPTRKEDVDIFCNILGEYGISATPRTRRGIDIDAGCGQLTQELKKKEKKVKISGFDKQKEDENNQYHFIEQTEVK